MRALALASLLSLTACGQPIRVGPLPVPERFLTCQDEPPAPARPAPEQRESVIARYIIDLQAAGRDCRDQLNAVRVYVEATAD